MSDIKGIIFNIQRFSIHDGPGIRTTVFMKGCPLRCKWCHNPEGLKRTPDVEFNPVKCIACGRCTVCPNGCHSIKDGMHIFDRTGCVACGKCTEECVSGSLQIAGTEYGVDEVIDKVLLDVPFYKESGGGMTVSGGEPLYQSEFTTELLCAAKERGLHTAIETCGFYSENVLKKALPYIDLFLFDYKVTGKEKHREMTGVDNTVILSNLRLINEIGKDIVLRCPIIPSVNDNEEHYDAIAAISEELEHIIRVDIEPYHDLGSSKYTNIGIKPSFTHETAPKSAFEPVREYIASKTSTKVIIS